MGDLHRTSSWVPQFHSSCPASFIFHLPIWDGKAKEVSGHRKVLVRSASWGFAARNCDALRRKVKRIRNQEHYDHDHHHHHDRNHNKNRNYDYNQLPTSNNQQPPPPQHQQQKKKHNPHFALQCRAPPLKYVRMCDHACIPSVVCTFLIEVLDPLWRLAYSIYSGL